MRVFAKTVVGLALVLALAGGAFANDWFQITSGDNVKGSGNVTTEKREIDDFDRIDLYIGADLVIKVGDEPSLTMTVDDNLHELINTDVVGHTLKIDSEGSWSTRKGCEIRITVSNLEEIRSYGSGYIEVKNLNGAIFSFELYGSGNFWAEGSLDEVEISLYGSGDVDTKDLQARDAYVVIGGSGDVEVTALESFDGVVNGSGDINFYGKPEHVSRQVNGSGRIRAR